MQLYFPSEIRFLTDWGCGCHGLSCMVACSGPSCRDLGAREYGCSHLNPIWMPHVALRVFNLLRFSTLQRIPHHAGQAFPFVFHSFFHISRAEGKCCRKGKNVVDFNMSYTLSQVYPRNPGSPSDISQQKRSIVHSDWLPAVIKTCTDARNDAVQHVFLWPRVRLSPAAARWGFAPGYAPVRRSAEVLEGHDSKSIRWTIECRNCSLTKNAQ